jgi:hypothetical protein
MKRKWERNIKIDFKKLVFKVTNDASEMPQAAGCSERGNNISGCKQWVI